MVNRVVGTDHAVKNTDSARIDMRDNSSAEVKLILTSVVCHSVLQGRCEYNPESGGRSTLSISKAFLAVKYRADCLSPQDDFANIFQTLVEVLELCLVVLVEVSSVNHRSIPFTVAIVWRNLLNGLMCPRVEMGPAVLYFSVEIVCDITIPL